uniref:Uncharacterized protein n=1 Tax=Anguilla anguilla TaxID=7936 RepID=A0A0E9TT48_ANGAN
MTTENNYLQRGESVSVRHSSKQFISRHI